MPHTKEMPSATTMSEIAAEPVMSESQSEPAKKLVVKKEKKVTEPKEKKPRAYSFIQAFA